MRAAGRTRLGSSRPTAADEYGMKDVIGGGLTGDADDVDSGETQDVDRRSASNGPGRKSSTYLAGRPAAPGETSTRSSSASPLSTEAERDACDWWAAYDDGRQPLSSADITVALVVSVVDRNMALLFFSCSRPTACAGSNFISMCRSKYASLVNSFEHTTQLYSAMRAASPSPTLSRSLASPGWTAMCFT